LDEKVVKSILAFGDSLTWGYKAGLSQRHAFEDRWPNVLAAGLVNKARVIEEGLNGRTTTYDDQTVSFQRNGAKALPMLLITHQPLDLLIIMLGTNDLKFRDRGAAFHAAFGIENLIELTSKCEYSGEYKAPKILVVSPPHLIPTDNDWFNDLWGHAIEESKLLAKHYVRVAEERKVHYFDAATVAKADPTDGGHLDAENTRAIGAALVPVVMKILSL
jgi:lysophospholipase L1-like esterase